MTELLRFFAVNSDYVVLYDDCREVAVLVGLDEDYSSRFHDNMNPLSDLIDEIFELGIEEIMFIDNGLKNSIIEELIEHNNNDRLKQFNKLCK